MTALPTAIPTPVAVAVAVAVAIAVAEAVVVVVRKPNSKSVIVCLRHRVLVVGTSTAMRTAAVLYRGV